MFSEKGTKPDPENAATVSDWKMSVSLKAIKALYPTTAAIYVDLLTLLLHYKGIEFVWTTDCQVALSL